jgi:hypothetical protein
LSEGREVEEGNNDEDKEKNGGYLVSFSNIGKGRIKLGHL